MMAPQTRVLLEHENPRVLEDQAGSLEAVGFRVDTCRGPNWQKERTCPLVARGYCSKAFGAEVIVNGLPLGDLRVYVAERAYLPDCPVLLGLSDTERARHPILDALAVAVPRNLSGPALVQAVRDAAA